MVRAYCLSVPRMHARKRMTGGRSQPMAVVQFAPVSPSNWFARVGRVCDFTIIPSIGLEIGLYSSTRVGATGTFGSFHFLPAPCRLRGERSEERRVGKE